MSPLPSAPGVQCTDEAALPAPSTDTRDANALATPFSLMDKLFAPQAWSATSKAKISDKLEVYFQEFDLMPLFVQVRPESRRGFDELRPEKADEPYLSISLPTGELPQA